MSAWAGVTTTGTAAMLRVRVGLLLVMGLVALPAPAAAQTETVEYYGLDAIGSVRVVFDASGAIVSRLDFGPFGAQLSPAAGAPKNKFAGLFRDEESGLDYAQARMYESRTGRFTRPDPVYAGLFEPQRWNRYAYARNSPLAFTDSTGMVDECVNPKPGCFASGTTGRPGGTTGGRTGTTIITTVVNEERWDPFPPGTRGGRGGSAGPGRPPGTGGGTGSDTDTTPPPDDPPKPEPKPGPPPPTPTPKPSNCGVRGVVASVGVSATAGANILFGIPFVGGGLSVGLDFRTGQVSVTAQANATIGAGLFAGVGLQAGVGLSRPLPSGFSQQGALFGEVNAGWGPSAGASASAGPGGVSVGKAIMPGVGYGVMAGVGGTTGTTYASPQLWCW